MMNRKIRVLVADDHEVMRYSVSALLDRQKGIEVVAQVGDGRKALTLAMRLKPDICVMDISMPELNGVLATRRITANLPSTRVIALSMHNDTEMIRRMFAAGASAFLLKETTFDELVAAINAVADGRTYVGVALRDPACDAWGGDGGSGSYAGLTDMEEEVLQLIAEGMSSKRVADTLGMSVHTVESHKKLIKTKLGVHTVVDLTRYAIRERIASV